MQNFLLLLSDCICAYLMLSKGKWGQAITLFGTKIHILKQKNPHSFMFLQWASSVNLFPFCSEYGTPKNKEKSWILHTLRKKSMEMQQTILGRRVAKSFKSEQIKQKQKNHFTSSLLIDFVPANTSGRSNSGNTSQTFSFTLRGLKNKQCYNLIAV